MTRVHCTAPGLQGKSKVPFAAIPHTIAGDPRLSPTDKALLLALTFWARNKDHCWPSDASIGARINRSEATVQRRLKHLETLRLIRREQAGNYTGRLIILAWRERENEGPPAAPVRAPALAPVRDERVVVVEGDASKVFEPHPERPRWEPLPEAQPLATQRTATQHLAAQRPAAPSPEPAPGRSQAPAVPLSPQQQARLNELAPAVRDKVLTWLALDDPITRREAELLLRPRPARRAAPATLVALLERLPEDPSYPALAAQALAQQWSDHKSWSGFHAVCTRAWRGELPVDVLLDAYRQASGPKAKNPGAILMHVVQRGARRRRPGR